MAEEKRFIVDSEKIKKVAHNLTSFLAGFVVIFKNLIPALCLIV